MFYAITGEDAADSLQARRNNRTAHLARLLELKMTGRLLLAGPHPAIDASDPGPAGFSGSLIVAEFASLEEARCWAEADPYLSAGVYRTMTVKPFIRVLP